jgi:hypothetical protein
MRYICPQSKSKELKELEDFEWFPKRLRQYQTGYIGFVVSQFGIYHAFTEHIRNSGTGSGQMFDLCSGSGEPAAGIFRKSGRFAKLILSDKFPQRYESSADITYIQSGCDVLTMKFDAGQTYTMFNALHHFDDVQKAGIIRRIRDSGSEAVFVEILQPDPWCFIKVLFATSVGTLILSPFIRPFSWGRIFFTYIIPVNLITIMFDGLTSVLKSRSLSRYQEMLEPLGKDIRVFKLKGLSPLIVIQTGTA